MDQGKASPELGSWKPPSKSKVTAGRMVVMAQLKNCDCCWGVNCGIVASQATSITAHVIGGAVGMVCKLKKNH
jgi:hypothetical protein